MTGAKRVERGVDDRKEVVERVTVVKMLEVGQSKSDLELRGRAMTPLKNSP